MSKIDDLAKILPIAEIYKDLLQPATKELGEGLKSVAKTARFALASFEILGNLHDRYLEFAKKVTKKTDGKELTKIHPKIAGTIFEGIRYLEEDSILFEMFAELLSSAITKEKSSLAHPAFVNVINQLSPDEAFMLFMFKQKEYEFWQQADFNRNSNRFYNHRIIRNDFPTDELTFPDNYTMYINHLNTLQIAGVPEYKNQEPIFENGVQTSVKIYKKTTFLDFGVLFSECCIPDNIVQKEGYK